MKSRDSKAKRLELGKIWYNRAIEDVIDYLQGEPWNTTYFQRKERIEALRK